MANIFSVSTIGKSSEKAAQVPQTIESFIRDRGGRVRIHKDCMVAYGMQTTSFQAAMEVALSQGYKVTSIHADGINSFRYFKEPKEVK